MKPSETHKSDTISRNESPTSEEKANEPPKRYQVMRAMVMAEDMASLKFGDGNRIAGQIEQTCTGEAFADVRQWCIAFRETRDAAKREALALQIFNELNAARALYVIEPAALPVTALGA